MCLSVRNGATFNSSSNHTYLLAFHLCRLHNTASCSNNGMDRWQKESENDRKNIPTCGAPDRVHVQWQSHMQQFAVHDTKRRIHPDAEGKHNHKCRRWRLI
jgi:hypothetical protein